MKFKNSINTYVCFCMKYGLNPFPADILQMRRYVTHLSDMHCSVDSMHNYVSGVHTLHLLMGFEAPAVSEYLYELTVKGIRRVKNHVVKQAEAVTQEILADCAQWINAQNGRELVAWTALLAGFYVMVRKSNLVPKTVNMFNPAQQFTWANFIRMVYGYEARIYWSKTIQFHDRCLQVPILPNPDIRICLCSGWTYCLVYHLPGLINLPLGIM